MYWMGGVVARLAFSIEARAAAADLRSPTQVVVHVAVQNRSRPGATLAPSHTLLAWPGAARDSNLYRGAQGRPGPICTAVLPLGERLACLLSTLPLQWSRGDLNTVRLSASPWWVSSDP